MHGLVKAGTERKGGVMRKSLPGKEVLLLMLMITAAWLLANHGPYFTRQVVGRLEQRVHSTQAKLSAVNGLLRSATPRFAGYAADVLLGAGVLVALLFLQLLVSTPLALFKLHRRVSRIENQLGELREELKRSGQIMEASLALQQRPHGSVDSWLDPAPSTTSLTGISPSPQGD